MEVTKATLAQQYGRMEIPELIDLLRTGPLTELSMQALKDELAKRGISPGQLEERVRILEQVERLRESRRDYYEDLPKALSRVKKSVLALYVIAGSQCLASLGFQFWEGVAFGVALAVSAFAIHLWKAPTAAVIVVILGVAASIVNFFGPMIVGLRFGNLILSLVTVWLGVRCYKAARLWEEATPIPSEELQVMPEPETEYREPAPAIQGKDWFDRAIALQMSNKFTDAIRAYSRALEADPNHADAYYKRAFVYSKLKKPEYAVKDLKAAARLGHGKSQAALKSKGIKW